MGLCGSTIEHSNVFPEPHHVGYSDTNSNIAGSDDYDIESGTYYIDADTYYVYIDVDLYYIDADTYYVYIDADPYHINLDTGANDTSTNWCIVDELLPKIGTVRVSAPGQHRGPERCDIDKLHRPEHHHSSRDRH
jgi:hypothetical protein